VLYSFTGGNDGSYPSYGVIFDGAGNLYGTTVSGGLYGYGVVFELQNSSGSWAENTLYSFTGGSDGLPAYGPLTFDTTGNLYGTANYGGVGYGTVFKLTPSLGQWTLTTLYAFTGGADGGYPDGSPLAIDGLGNLYGTTHNAGRGYGVVFEVTP
jgi:uncharacterized repeat protein (TIGR03803 family)